MKTVKKMPAFNLHLRIFMLLSIAIWLLVGVLHVNILFTGTHISLGEIMLPRSISYFALAGIIGMAVMGIYYYLALRPSKKITDK